MNRKLLIINQFASTPANLFGAGERIYHLSPFLKEQSFDLTVISGGYNHLFKKYPNTDKLFNEEQFSSVKFVWVKLRKYNHLSFLGRVISWFEFLFKLFRFKIEEKPDIVLVSSMSLLPIIYAIWLRYRYKSRFILEIRDIWPLTPIDIGGYSKYNPLLLFLKWVERLGYKKADFIVSVLPGFQKYLSENGFGKKNFMWIPNGVNSQNDQEEIKSNVVFDNNKFNVIYTGTIGKANALEDFVEAAHFLESYKEIQLIIIGDGPDKVKLLDVAQKKRNISFLEKVPKREIHSILTKADVCYIGWHNKKLYNYGVSANKYNDYMLAGRPILSSSNIEKDPVNLSNSGLQVKANDPKAIAEGIVKLYKMSIEERNNLGQNGFDFVNSNQIYPVLAKKYIAVLDEVLFK